MAKRVSVDGWLFTVTLIAGFCGAGDGIQRFGGDGQRALRIGYYFLISQLVWAVGGMVAMVAAMKMDYHRLQASGARILGAGITTLLLISVFFLDRAHDTHRWIHWGRIFLAAFGAGQAGIDPFSGLLSGEPHQLHGRLAQYATASGVADPDLSRIDCLAA